MSAFHGSSRLESRYVQPQLPRPPFSQFEVQNFGPTTGHVISSIPPELLHVKVQLQPRPVVT